MIEHALWEGSSWGEFSQMLGEPEWLSDWQVSSNDKERCSINWLFSNNDTSSCGKALIDTSHSIIRCLDFTQEDGFLESGLSSQDSSIVDSSGSGDDLSTTSVDGISMEYDIEDVESNTSHVLFSHDWFFGGPLECSFHWVFDFIKILGSLGLIAQEVGSWGFWSETPYLSAFSFIPFILLEEDLVSLFDVHFEGNNIVINVSGEFLSKWGCFHEDSVMLVWWFGKALCAAGGWDSFFVCDDWVRFLDFNLGIFID